MRRSTPARYRFYVPLAALWLAMPAGITADEPQAVSVAIRPSVTFAGGEVRTTIRTPRDPRNRALRIVVEAAEYYASSDVQLDGDGAAAMHQFTWKALPGGAYRVDAILTRDDGEERSVTSCFAVLGGEENAEGSARRRMAAPTPDARGSC